ncbi:hypothetical protein [Paenibacillus algicola]|nr:hypothetical protein [Paenibacillus algicola]
MKLADMLSYADISHLNNIASYYDCDCKRNSKHELIQSILIKAGRKEFLKEQWKSFSPGDLRFLNNLVFDTRSSYSLEDLLAAVRHTSLEEKSDETPGSKPARTALESPREAVSRYRRSGWLFNGFTSSTKYMFHVPEDLKERFREELSLHLKSGLQVSMPPEVYREEQGLITEDLKLMLRYFQEHELTLNAEGFMYRKQQQQLLSTLHIEESLITKGPWRFGYGRSCSEYPDRFALLYDYAVAQRWVQETPAGLTLTEHGKECILSGNQVSMIQLFRFWLKIYKSAVPNLPSLVYWLGRCAKEWVTMDSLHATVGSLVTPFYYDTPRMILERRIVKMLLHLGMLRLGESQTLGTVIRMTPLGIKAGEIAPQLGHGTVHNDNDVII